MLTVCGKGFDSQSNTHRVRVERCAIMDGVDIIATYGNGTGGACVIISREDAAKIGRYLIELSGESP